jgi:hypothetical protein
MIKDRPVNRRELFTTIAGGVVLGGLWGVAFPVFARENRPSVAIVGHRHAQIALVDSSSARALILLGEPDDRLIDQLPAMMTLFRQRIDLVIGSDTALAPSAADLNARWTTKQAIAFQSTTRASNPPIPTITVLTPISIDLDGHVTLVCSPGHRDEWLASSPQRTSPIWSIELRHSGSTIVFAPDALSLASATPASATMIVTPDAPSQATLRRTTASAWAVNHDTVNEYFKPSDGVALTRIYPEDISRFVWDNSTIVSPPWTQMPEEVGWHG